MTVTIALYCLERYHFIVGVIPKECLAGIVFGKASFGMAIAKIVRLVNVGYSSYGNDFMTHFLAWQIACIVWAVLTWCIICILSDQVSFMANNDINYQENGFLCWENIEQWLWFLITRKMRMKLTKASERSLSRRFEQLRMTIQCNWKFEESHFEWDVISVLFRKRLG